jgi:predicted NAD/FAD-dependent oxidoreductase
MTDSEFEIAIVGAGIAGLTCAKQLQATGRRVVVLEKSRGVGGRVATRRLQDTCVDHGTCDLSLKHQSPPSQQFESFVNQLLAAKILHVWTDTVHQMDKDGNLSEPDVTDRAPRYVAASGMSAIAKFLASDLDLRLNQRVEQLHWQGDRWQLVTIGEPSGEITAKVLVMAIPAPQAIVLLQPLAELLPVAFLDQLKSVHFFPCLSVMAGYAAKQQQAWFNQYPNVKAIGCSRHPDFGWIGVDSTKRSDANQTIFVFQSSAGFAEPYLAAIDLQPAGWQLLNRAAKQLAPWLNAPEWLQVHRWRYAFPRTPLSTLCLAAEPLPLICAGDWCGGQKVEAAMRSGLASADQILQFNSSGLSG